jgi:hypothetical protein
MGSKAGRGDAAEEGDGQAGEGSDCGCRATDHGQRTQGERVVVDKYVREDYGGVLVRCQREDEVYEMRAGE